MAKQKLNKAKQGLFLNKTKLISLRFESLRESSLDVIFSFFYSSEARNESAKRILPHIKFIDHLICSKSLGVILSIA